MGVTYYIALYNVPRAIFDRPTFGAVLSSGIDRILFNYKTDNGFEDVQIVLKVCDLKMPEEIPRTTICMVVGKDADSGVFHALDEDMMFDIAKLLERLVRKHCRRAYLVDIYAGPIE